MLKSVFIKKSFMLFLFLVYTLTIFSIELIHNYYGDYKEVVRIVFVLRTQVHHTTLMDTDNKKIEIKISETRINPSLFKLNFESTSLLDDIIYETIGRDLTITINTNFVYYAECFTLVENVYKIVIDVFRQKEPTTMEQARDYVTFYRTVGYHDRANALQRRINNKEFITHIYQQQPNYAQPTSTPPPISVQIEKQADFGFSNDDLFNYTKPNINSLPVFMITWINDAFRIYDLFKEIRIILDKAENTLLLYDSQKTIDIGFLETMSISHNSLSDAHIKINEIKLAFQNLLNNKNFTPNEPTSYTEKMINHVLQATDMYRIKVTNIQNEYARRINR